MPELHALTDWLRPERGEQRRYDRAELQRTQDCDVQLGNAAEEGEHCVAGAYTERGKRAGHAVRLLFELSVRQLLTRAVLAEQDQGEALAVRAHRVPRDRLVCNVQPTAGEAVERRPRALPRKGSPGLVVVDEVRRDRPRCRFEDWFPTHERLPCPECERDSQGGQPAR